MALYDPEVRKALKITDEQVGKLKELADKSFKAVQKHFDDRDMKKVTEVVREAHEKLAEILTDEQKTTWKEMLGKRFELKPDKEYRLPGRASAPQGPPGGRAARRAPSVGRFRPRPLPAACQGLLRRRGLPRRRGRSLRQLTRPLQHPPAARRP